MCFIYSLHRNHRSSLVVTILYIDQVLSIASWRGFSFSFLCQKKWRMLYWTGKYSLVPKKRGGFLISRRSWNGLENLAKWDNTVSTHQLKNVEPCNVNNFQIFLKEREKSTNRGWGKGRLFDSEANILVYKSSLLEVFLQKGVLKKWGKFSCKKTPM